MRTRKSLEYFEMFSHFSIFTLKYNFAHNHNFHYSMFYGFTFTCIFYVLRETFQCECVRCLQALEV